MRTTISLPADVLEAARARAAARNITLSRFVQEAVQAALARRDALGADDFEVITYGDRAGHAPRREEIAAKIEEEEHDALRPPRR